MTAKKTVPSQRLPKSVKQEESKPTETTAAHLANGCFSEEHQLDVATRLRCCDGRVGHVSFGSAVSTPSRNQIITGFVAEVISEGSRAAHVAG